MKPSDGEEKIKEDRHHCPFCGNGTSYRGESGDDDESPCPLCEGDEQAQASWERDNFGDN